LLSRKNDRDRQVRRQVGVEEDMITKYNIILLCQMCFIFSILHQVECKEIAKKFDNMPGEIFNNLELKLQSRIIQKKNNKRLQDKDGRIRLLKTNHQNTKVFDLNFTFI